MFFSTKHHLKLANISTRKDPETFSNSACAVGLPEVNGQNEVIPPNPLMMPQFVFFENFLSFFCESPCSGGCHKFPKTISPWRWTEKNCIFSRNHEVARMSAPPPKQEHRGKLGASFHHFFFFSKSRRKCHRKPSILTINFWQTNSLQALFGFLDG